MAHLQYMPGDPRLVDQLVYELKSKGIFDQLRKDCISDVDTRPAYQNLRQRVENSVSTFLSRQVWKPELNKNQLREKLRKHILDGNYLEQGVERIVDQVVNPKMATVFIPQVEDLVYNYLGITRKKTTGPETSETKPGDLLPTDLEAVSPGSVKSDDDQNDAMETDEKTRHMNIEQEGQVEVKEGKMIVELEKIEKENIEIPEVTMSNDSVSMDKSYTIPLPTEEINLQDIPAPVNSPPKATKVELESICLPHEPNLSTDIPLPDEAPKDEKVSIFKPIQLQSDESNSSSDSSLRRNMSPLTPIRNFNNENSCDAQQAFDNDSDAKSDEKAAPSSFRFTIETTETKDMKLTDNSLDVKPDKKELEQTDLSYQFNNQVNINTFNTPMYDDSSNSNNLHIDYESDVNSKTNTEVKPEMENYQDSKKEKKSDDRKSSHKSSHRSRDSSIRSSSKDKRSDSKQSTSRDSSRHEKKSSITKDDKYKSSKERERSKDRSDRKDSRDSSKHRSSYKSSNNKDKDSRSHRSSSSSHRHSSKSLDERKSSSSKDKEKISDSSRDKTSKDKSKDPKNKSGDSSSHRSDKDRKSSSSMKKSDDKDKKKEKKDTDDHYSLSGRGNHNRRSTDRDSNDGSSSSKGSHNQNGSKSIETKKESKGTSKSDNTSTSGDSASPSDKERIVQDNSKISQFKPIVRVDNHLETPIAISPRLPFVPEVTLKKPRFAANLQEAKKLMKMRKFLDEEQKKMNQEAALLLEFQANVRPNLSQVYSSIPGPELEFVCGSNIQDSVPYEVINIKTVESENEPTKNDSNSVMEVANVSETANDSETEVVKSPDIQTDETLSEIINIVENIVRSKSMEKQVFKQTDEQIIKPEHPESPDEQEDNNDISYDENKPFSELMDEITEYSKISESKTKDNEESKSESEDSLESQETIVTLESQESIVTLESPESIVTLESQESIVTLESQESIVTLESQESIVALESPESIVTLESQESIVTLESQESIVTLGSPESIVTLKRADPIENENCIVASANKDSVENESTVTTVNTVLTENLETEDTTNNIQKKYFEVTIITEELSESEEPEIEPTQEDVIDITEDSNPIQDGKIEIAEEPTPKQDVKIEIAEEPTPECSEIELQYFAEHEKYSAELERHEFSNFLKSFIEKVSINKKIYVINCDTYEENIVKDMASTFGDYEVINYYKNGHLKLPNTSKNIVKNVTLSTEITLPIESTEYEENSTLFSPVKSDCSRSSSEYDVGIDDITKKSRQEVMEIILGGLLDSSPSKMPKIDYYTEPIDDEIDNFKSDIESEIKTMSSTVESETERNLKRKIDELESSVNNNRSVLTPNKIRKMSDSDQISSTTEETEEVSNNNKVSTRSKYLGRARRVGLSRPKRCNFSNSPSSDKSVENYVQKNSTPTANGKMKNTPRTKVQRYDTADLYKPKLHYLSRRHNVS